MSASSDSRGTKPLFWRARDAQTKARIIKNRNFLCLSSPSAILAHQHYGDFCTTSMASCKGLIKFMNPYKTSRLVFASDGVWGSRRTLITQSKTTLDLVSAVISACRNWKSERCRFRPTSPMTQLLTV